MTTENARAIAAGLQKALLANDAEAIGAGVSALSIALGGVELINAPWSASMQTLYLLSLVVENQRPHDDIGGGSNVVSIHGLPLSAG